MSSINKGFGDSDNDDNGLIDEMMSVLKGTLKGANAIVLLVNGQDQRVNAAIQQMLREMQVYLLIYFLELPHHIIWFFRLYLEKNFGITL